MSTLAHVATSVNVSPRVSPRHTPRLAEGYNSAQTVYTYPVRRLRTLAADAAREARGRLLDWSLRVSRTSVTLVVLVLPAGGTVREITVAL